MQAIVGAALQQRILVLILAAALIAGGLFAYKRLNIEAYPDPVPPLVDIVTQNPGQSSEEIERYITIPIEVQMAGLPFVTSIRTISLTGLSDVKVQFTYDISYREASQLVINRLSQLGPLPNGAQPFISPTSPIGEIFRYRVVGPPGYSVTDLKTIQDWILQRRLKSIPGVIDVTTWGGKSKTYDITVDLDKLLAYGITLKQVLDALNGANVNVGANTVNLGPQSAVIRSVGQIRTMADIGHTMLTVRDGSPVLVSDVATITVGNEPRLGVAGHDNDDDIVQGIVLMRRGAETLPTLRAVEKEVDRINGSDLLPPGVRIQRVYDRSVLVDVTTSTVLHNMVMGVCLVFLIQWLFLGDLRSALIVSATIPFALLVRRGGPGAERRIGQPAVDGRHRLRHHRRRHRHHGREHLPPPRRDERRPCAAIGARHAARAQRQARRRSITPRARSRRRSSSRPPSSSRASCRCSPCRASRATSSGRWPRPTPMRCRAACWPPSPSRPRSPPCCCPTRCRRPRRSSCACCAGSTAASSTACWCGAASRWRSAAACWSSPPSPPARSGWNSCPSSRRATSGCGRRCRRRCRSTRATSTPIACAGWSRASPRSRRSSPSMAGPTTAPTPTASPTSSSSCR